MKNKILRIVESEKGFHIQERIDKKKKKHIFFGLFRSTEIIESWDDFEKHSIKHMHRLAECEDERPIYLSTFSIEPIYYNTLDSCINRINEIQKKEADELYQERLKFNKYHYLTNQ